LLSEVVEDARTPVTAVGLGSEVECFRLDFGIDLGETGIECLDVVPSIYRCRFCGVFPLVSDWRREERSLITH